MTTRPDDLRYTIGEGPCFIGALQPHGDTSRKASGDTGSNLVLSTLGEWLDEQGFPRRTMKDLFKQGLVRLDGRKAAAHSAIQGGQELVITCPKESIDHDPVPMDLPILYEDGDLLVLHKPWGMTVNSVGQISLANGVAQYFKEERIHRKVRFLSRLDRDTEGCIAIAKHPLSQSFYQYQMEQHIYQKWYRAVVEGQVHLEDWKNRSYVELLTERPQPLCGSQEEATLGALLTFSVGMGEDGIRRIVMDGGKPTATYVEVVSYDAVADASTLRIGLLSGKTHQIRLSLAELGHPLVNDVLYGAKGDGQTPFALQAYEVSFQSLRTKKRVTVLSQI